MKLNRITLFSALLFASMLAPRLHAHEVPDRVRVAIFVKVEQDHLTVLVRLPANALIDYLLPTLAEDDFVDVANAGPLAEEGANVWIANLLAFSEGDRALQRPKPIAVRLSRANDPAFRTFDDALARIRSPPLSPDTRLRQDQLTVDVLLETPIRSPSSAYFFQPRFARLGVVVDTSLTFLPFAGGLRVFKYQSDPPPFELDPGRATTLRNFMTAGFDHYFAENDYALFAICIALLFARTARMLKFLAVFVCAQVLSLFIALSMMANAFWLHSVCGAAIAAAIVYMGAEAIINHDAHRRILALITGLIFGYGAWIGLQPQIQFGGVHLMVAGIGFAMGLLIAEVITLIGCTVAAFALRRYSQAPRRLLIIAAAVVIHIAWRRLLDRADGLALVPSYGRGPEATTLVAWVLAFLAVATVVNIYRKKINNSMRTPQ